MAELGCCERVMRNLSAVNQMTDLKAPGTDAQNEQKWKIPDEPKLMRRATLENQGIVKNVIEQNLANFM